MTHVTWCMSGSLTSGGLENVPAFPAHARPTIFRIWQEAHGHRNHCNHWCGTSCVVLHIYIYENVFILCSSFCLCFIRYPFIQLKDQLNFAAKYIKQKSRRNTKTSMMKSQTKQQSPSVFVGLAASLLINSVVSWRRTYCLHLNGTTNAYTEPTGFVIAITACLHGRYELHRLPMCI